MTDFERDYWLQPGAMHHEERKQFVYAKAMGLRPGLSYDNIEELLDVAEGPYHK